MKKTEFGITTDYDYLQKDILFVKFPFTDFQSFKNRPVIVISNDDYNSKALDLVVCAITSNLVYKDYAVLISNDDLDKGYLIKETLIKTSHIATISKHIVIRKIASLNNEKFEEVKKNLELLFKSSGTDDKDKL
ncbi:MAG: MazF family transcriptional regulator [Candidatus Altiarchaeales archaeon HGW-Altiarchaeales-2]|nr:MAG: MazF family transcriptional regulator [Candidatus Altiarchaeales archaeon HGW-Altiarchaeales-2]